MQRQPSFTNITCNEASNTGKDAESSSKNSAATEVLINLDSASIATSTRMDHLPYHLRILFALNGGTEALPVLAYLSIVNDWINIEPAYLPAYYAVAFLPYSLKPMYAMATNWITGDVLCKTIQRHILLGGLLFVSSIMIMATAFLKPNQNIACFIIAFGRGVFISWAEFLLGVELISVAQNLHTSGKHLQHHESMTEHTNEKVHGNDSTNHESIRCIARKMSEEEEKALSLYQSQAALSRNLGSLVSQIILFCLFVYRQYEYRVKLLRRSVEDSDSDNASISSDESESTDQLSTQVVTSILFVTSMLPLLASYIAIKYRVGKRNSLPSANKNLAFYRNASDSLVDTSTLANGRREEYATCTSVTHTLGGSEKTNLKEEQFNFMEVLATRNAEDFPLTQDELHCCNPTEEHNISSMQPSEEHQVSSIQVFDMKYDMTALLLFQAVLVTYGLRAPIISITSGITLNILLITLVVGMLGAIFCSYYHYRHKNIISNDGGRLRSSTEEMMEQHSSELEMHSPTHIAAGKLKRVALYLIIRHAIPSTGILSSYLYSILRTRPSYLQVMSILESVSATLSSWFYRKYLAEHFSGITKISKLIAITTILYSIFSLLNILIVHIAAESEVGKEDSNTISFELTSWAIASITIVQIFIKFFDELSFMPSIILATTSIVSHGSHHKFEKNSHDIDFSNSETETIQSKERKLDNEIQYGLLISCIDFGSQLSDWTSIPLIEALGIQRENTWENLDWLIAICAVLSIMSLVFLRIIK